VRLRLRWRYTVWISRHAVGVGNATFDTDARLARLWTVDGVTIAFRHRPGVLYNVPASFCRGVGLPAEQVMSTPPCLAASATVIAGWMPPAPMAIVRATHP
jgi:hypothetical protein